MWPIAITVVSAGCDRPSLPPAGLAAAADAVVIGHGVEGRLVVDRVLRGEVALAGPASHSRPRLEAACGQPVALPDSPNVLYLRRDPEGWLVLADGRAPAGLGVPGRALASLARAGATGWSAVADGWSTLIVEEVEPAGPEAVLTAGIRNHGPAARTMRWTDWPRAHASHVTLEIRGPGGPVAPLPTSLPQAAIDAHLSTSGRTFDVTLQPGEFWLFSLPSIDAAPEGAGYREALNFVSYPLDRPGRYEITARFHGLAEPVPPPTAPLTLRRYQRP